MTGTHTQNPIYSRITMALMEDTGWYLPNYDMADELKWGRNLGCDFVLRYTIFKVRYADRKLPKECPKIMTSSSIKFLLSSFESH